MTLTMYTSTSERSNNKVSKAAVCILTAVSAFVYRVTRYLVAKRKPNPALRTRCERKIRQTKLGNCRARLSTHGPVCDQSLFFGCTLLGLVAHCPPCLFSPALSRRRLAKALLPCHMLCYSRLSGTLKGWLVRHPKGNLEDDFETISRAITKHILRRPEQDPRLCAKVCPRLSSRVLPQYAYF